MVLQGLGEVSPVLAQGNVLMLSLSTPKACSAAV